MQTDKPDETRQGVLSLEFGAESLEHWVWSLELGAWSLELGAWRRIYRLVAYNQELGARAGLDFGLGQDLDSSTRSKTPQI